MHPTRQTPGNAVLALGVLTLVLGIGLGLLMAPSTAFGFFGIVETVAYLVIYALISVACIRFFWKQRRSSFSMLRHGIIPAVGTVFIGVVLYGSVIPPGPFPFDLAPYLVGAWIVIGFGVLLYLTRRRPEEVRRAGALFVAGEVEPVVEAVEYTR